MSTIFAPARQLGTHAPALSRLRRQRPRSPAGPGDFRGARWALPADKLDLGVRHRLRRCRPAPRRPVGRVFSSTVRGYSACSACRSSETSAASLLLGMTLLLCSVLLCRAMAARAGSFTRVTVVRALAASARGGGRYRLVRLAAALPSGCSGWRSWRCSLAFSREERRLAVSGSWSCGAASCH